MKKKRHASSSSEESSSSEQSSSSESGDDTKTKKLKEKTVTHKKKKPVKKSSSSDSDSSDSSKSDGSVSPRSKKRARKRKDSSSDSSSSDSSDLDKSASKKRKRHKSERKGKRDGEQRNATTLTAWPKSERIVVRNDEKPLPSKHLQKPLPSHYQIDNERYTQSRKVDSQTVATSSNRSKYDERRVDSQHERDSKQASRYREHDHSRTRDKSSPNKRERSRDRKSRTSPLREHHRNVGKSPEKLVKKTYPSPKRDNTRTHRSRDGSSEDRNNRVNERNRRSPIGDRRLPVERPRRSSNERTRRSPNDRGRRSSIEHNRKSPNERDRRSLNDRDRRSPGQNRSNNRSFPPRRRSRDPGNYRWGKDTDGPKDKETLNKEKDKPNFALSGKLTEQTNTFKGVVVKYTEPAEARKPKRRWRLYPFKGEQAMATLYIHRESAYLLGRERKVVDIPLDHPSCSKQHAALQYRLVAFKRDDGSVGKRVRPYVIDLGSANGTYINNKRVDPQKYVELFEKDVLKFGFSSREYVLLHENSKEDGDDDDVKGEDSEGELKEEKPGVVKIEKLEPMEEVVPQEILIG